MNLRHVLKRKLYVDMAAMLPMYIYHFALTYPVFGSVKLCLAFFLFYRVIDIGIFIWLSQVNHIVMHIHDDNKDESWLKLQVI